jgi:hypothetical protein
MVTLVGAVVPLAWKVNRVEVILDKLLSLLIN